MSLFDKISGLPLKIDSYSLRQLSQAVSGPQPVRKTVLLELQDAGASGVGEDVTYFEPLQKSVLAAGPVLPLSGSYTFSEFSERLAALDYFPDAPKNVFGEAFRNYRRWAIESAALDLALQQAGATLAEALGLQLSPLNFVASLRLGEPSSVEPVRRHLKRNPDLRFKLDPVNDWTDELIKQLAETQAVDTLDFKGFYKGTPVEVKTDPTLYKKVVDAFPQALLEDPDVSEETRPILEPHADRITWDFPIHDVGSINSQTFKSKIVNIKPSRFGPIKELFSTYDYCRNRGIGMYSGGQTELGPGRGQVQYLSALFHPDAPNDIAPSAYNSADIADDLPDSPLTLQPKPSGFGLIE